MNKTSVVVGRFETSHLTEGHLKLLNTALETNSNLVIVVGDTEAKLTTHYPLTFDIRVDMLLEAFPMAKIHRLHNHESNEIWSQNLDALLVKYENPTFFVSRDSFISCYSGEHPHIYVDEVVGVSATQVRASLKHYNPEKNNQSFREGIIHIIQNKYPTTYPTVDIAVLKYMEGTPTIILLGRKPNHTKWCLSGGFVDPTDASMEAAAGRELHEEVLNIQTHELTYVGSSKINDSRYRDTTDGIMTTLFMTYYLSGNPVAGDDLEEVKWFSFEEAEQVIGEHHKPLLNKIKAKINE